MTEIIASLEFELRVLRENYVQANDLIQRLKSELKATKDKYAALTIMVSRAESRAVDAIAKERDALKAKLEAIRPVPPVSDWLAEHLHVARARSSRTGAESPYWGSTVAVRDWLETILGEPVESDPWKDRRGN